MTPYHSNSDKENCSPISSNCVIWQGPDLKCINLCKGDSVSDVVYKVAVELCDIKEAIKLTDVDFDCLVDACDDLIIPADKKLENVIQLLTNAICCVGGVAYNTSSSLAEVIDREYTEPVLPLPQCLWYTDPATGILVTNLLLSDYVVVVANKLCDLTQIVATQGAQILDLQVRVTDLENTPGYVPPQVVPFCTYGTVVEGVPTEIDILLSNLDQRICTLISNLGDAPDLGLAANSQCDFLNTQDALSQSGTMASLPGWNNSISNFAQSMQNLWLTVCDMRAAIYDLKNCCSVDCSAFFLVYQATRNIAGSQVTLIFNSGTVIPSGFVNCPTLSTVSITDGNGHTYTTTLDLLVESTNPVGITYDVSTSSLNPNLPYTVTVNGCIEKDGKTCSKQVTQVIQPSTTTTTSTTSTTTTSTSTTTSSTSTTSTTTTTTCGPCYYWTVSPQSNDLTDATGNSNILYNGVIFVDFVDCEGVSTTVPFNSIVPDQPLGCSCNVPYAYYYKNNFVNICDSGTLTIDSLCAPV
jgi:hypothetical protein